MSINAKSIQYLQEMFNKEDIGENTDILQITASHFFAIDKSNKNVYRFIFDDKNIDEDSDTQYMYIVDERSFEYMIFQVSIKERNTSNLGQSRISFAEKYIKEFVDTPTKEFIIEELNEQ